MYIGNKEEMSIVTFVQMSCNFLHLETGCTVAITINKFMDNRTNIITFVTMLLTNASPEETL